METPNKRTRVGFIGVGKLGKDVAEVIQNHYMDIQGYDINPVETSIKMLNTIEATVINRNIVFIAVPTPHDPDYDGRYPTSHLPPKDFNYEIVKEVVAEADKYMEKDALLVLISTTLPGTVRNEIVPLVKNARFIYNPYLIAQTTVKWDMVHPEMVIIGTEDGDITKEAEELIKFYKPIVEPGTRYEIGTWDEAEGIKIFYNTFISTKLALVNMIQDVAEKNGHMNVDIVTKALKDSKKRIMGPSYMKAGFGDGGGCHPRDNIALRYMAQRLNLGYDLFDAIMKAREVQAENMAKFVAKFGNEVIILGKGFKPDTDQEYGSPSILVGYYIEQMGLKVHYDVCPNPSKSYTYLIHHPNMFHDVYISTGSVVVDPWRDQKTPENERYKVVHYGNTRNKSA